MKKSIRLPLILLFSAVLLYSGYRLWSAYAEYGRSEAAKDALIDLAVFLNNEEALVLLPGGGAMAAEIEADTAPEAVDFDALRTVNPDIAGWLYCAGTPINDPVVRGGDNTFYLDHLFTGEANKSGTLFMDCRCGSGFSDTNSIIYGHHMKNGGMFASIVKYRSQRYYDSHPVMYLLTPDGDYRLEVFSGYTTESGSGSYTIRFDRESEYAAFLKDTQEKSDFVSGVTPASSDRIVTLSTCTYAYDDARYVLHAVLHGMD